jgi:hypothetical protein
MELQKLSRGALIAIVVTGVLLTVATLGAVTTFQNVPSNGSVVTAVNLDLYSDVGCTQSLTSIAWGNVAPSSTNPRTIYIKNTGNVPETLTMATSAWNPSNATLVLACSWNLGSNTVLNASASIPAILTLTVGSNPGSLTNFSFNITITGTQ